MANELTGATNSGETCYALISKKGVFWNGSSLESYSAANYSDYLIDITEAGSSGIYLGDFPSSITSSGTYEYFVKRQAGASPAEDDAIISTGRIDWTGTSAESASSGSMSGSDWYAYVLRGGFKRTDKETEVFEETTDAVQEMRRIFMFDEAETERTTTDTIVTLGDYRLAVEDDLGLLLGVTVEDGDNADPLIKITKSQFNQMYPDVNVTADRGYPKHFALFGGTIHIGPIPDRVTYSYRIAYSKRAGTITSSTTAVPFTKDYRDVLRLNVLGRLYFIMDEFEKSAQMRALFVDWFEEAKRRDRANSGAGTFNVAPFGL